MSRRLPPGRGGGEREKGGEWKRRGKQKKESDCFFSQLMEFYRILLRLNGLWESVKFKVLSMLWSDNGCFHWAFVFVCLFLFVSKGEEGWKFDFLVLL